MYLENILVIDDDPYVLEYLKEALERQNYRVTTVDNGEEGISTFNNQNFDIVFVDMILPNMNGIEVLKKIKEISPQTIVIIITANATIENVVESMKLGAYNYLTKPLSTETLKAVIDKAKENQKILNENKYALDTISINGIQTDPGFIKF